MSETGTIMPSQASKMTSQFSGEAALSFLMKNWPLRRPCTINEKPQEWPTFSFRTCDVSHDHWTPVIPQKERASGLAFLPVFATIAFYVLPANWQLQPAVQFAPQLMAYGALSVWAYRNVDQLHKLGLAFTNIQPGVLRGTLVGITLGILNTGVILYVMPVLGVDINFLSQTPHAQIPFWIMMPWFIILIAMGVELNFRGFLLGRLLVWFHRVRQPDRPSATRNRLQTFLPLSISALTFSFDPFMVSTFRDLHWIAIWDGLVWGCLWMRMHNLYTVIAAHAVEVILLYLIIRGILT